jgi:hypothetical protein
MDLHNIPTGLVVNQEDLIRKQDVNTQNVK